MSLFANFMIIIMVGTDSCDLRGGLIISNVSKARFL